MGHFASGRAYGYTLEEAARGDLYWTAEALRWFRKDAAMTAAITRLPTTPSDEDRIKSARLVMKLRHERRLRLRSERGLLDTKEARLTAFIEAIDAFLRVDP